MSDPNAMTGLDLTAATAENYRRFGRLEAAGRSAAYEVLSLAVAEDAEVLDFLSSLPAEKRQPNLLFAAARYLLGAPADPGSLHHLVAERSSDLAKVMTTRRTQTNEAARCATLLPALCSLPEPIALLEVGAAAGLTLLVDRYSYDYGGHVVEGKDREAPTLSCRTAGPVPLPDKVPEVVWRTGLDLNPLDVDDPADVEWLHCLLWPGQPERAERLSGAVEVARRTDGLRLVKGDLRYDLEEVAASAPADASLVVFHTAVLAYVPVEDRRPFGDSVARLGGTWLSNEGAGVIPGVSDDKDPRGFLLIRDGLRLLARTDPHGTWIDWF